MPKPLVLICADVREADGYEWHAAPSTYLQAAIRGADAIPLILPSLAGAIDLDEVLDRVDGVLLTGARSNVDPTLYGGEASETNGPYDPQRDAMTQSLIRRTLSRGVPLLAICRGMQELNVALGGTLATEIQQLPGRLDHRAPEAPTQAERFALAHRVQPAAGGCLAAILGSTPVQVNSLHRQAVDRLAPGLVVEATAEDGTIEAARPSDAPGWCLATQWHPEYWVDSDDASRRLFAAFGEAMRAWQQRRGAARVQAAE